MHFPRFQLGKLDKKSARNFAFKFGRFKKLSAGLGGGGDAIAPLPPASIKPGLHIVVIVASTVANMFLTVFQAVLIHVNTLITTSQA